MAVPKLICKKIILVVVVLKFKNKTTPLLPGSPRMFILSKFSQPVIIGERSAKRNILYQLWLGTTDKQKRRKAVNIQM